MADSSKLPVPGEARLAALSCSFCNKDKDAIAKLVAGPGVYICNECIRLCNDVLEAERDMPPGQARPKAQLPAWDKLTDDQLLELLPRMAAVSDQAESTLKQLVTILRERRVTWARIGAALAITRQSAWERFSDEE